VRTGRKHIRDQGLHQAAVEIEDAYRRQAGTLKSKANGRCWVERVRVILFEPQALPNLF
jgi:hypothetical protein